MGGEVNQKQGSERRIKIITGLKQWPRYNETKKIMVVFDSHNISRSDKMRATKRFVLRNRSLFKLIQCGEEINDSHTSSASLVPIISTPSNVNVEQLESLPGNRILIRK